MEVVWARMDKVCERGYAIISIGISEPITVTQLARNQGIGYNPS